MSMSEIYINYGANPQEMTYELMKAAKISERLNPSMRVCIKPNLVTARLAKYGATTHPEIVEGIILYLRDFGVRSIVIAEGAAIEEGTKAAFNACGYTAFTQKYGVELLDTKKDHIVYKTSQGFKLALCESFLQADYMINVPVLKGHCQTNMTCCLKNLKGCIPDSEKRRFHTIGLHDPIAALSAALKPDLHIVDGICGDLSFELGGNPVEANRIMLGFDPVLLDSYGAKLIGYKPEEIEHLCLAMEYGVGQFVDEHTKIIEINSGNKPKINIANSKQAQSYGKLIDEDGACSVCYAALIYALHQTGRKNFAGKIHIGQGYKEKNIEGIGVGNCAAGCRLSVSGCPPKASDVVEFIGRI